MCSHQNMLGSCTYTWASSQLEVKQIWSRYRDEMCYYSKAAHNSPEWKKLFSCQIHHQLATIKQSWWSSQWPLSISILTEEPLFSPQTWYETSECNLFSFFIIGAFESWAPSPAKDQGPCESRNRLQGKLPAKITFVSPLYLSLGVSFPSLTQFPWHIPPLPKTNLGTVSKMLRPYCVFHTPWRLQPWCLDDCWLTHLSPVWALTRHSGSYACISRAWVVFACRELEMALNLRFEGWLCHLIQVSVSFFHKEIDTKYF